MMKKIIKMMAAFSLMLSHLVLPTASAQEGMDIVTTIYPVYYLAKRIAQPDANITMLVPSGGDAHGYEPSTQDVVKIQEADMFIYQSQEMEFFMQAMAPVLEDGEVTVVESVEGLQLLKGSDDHDHDHDPVSYTHLTLPTNREV